VEHRIAHSLSVKKARSVARTAAEDYVGRLANHELRVSWQDEDHAAIMFRAAGKNHQAQVRLEPGAIVVSMEVPFLLRPLIGRVTSVIDTHVRKVLESYENE
jgi:hypothetical protein